MKKSSRFKLEESNSNFKEGAWGKSFNFGNGRCCSWSESVLRLKESREDLSQFKFIWQFGSKTFFPASYGFFKNAP